MEDLSFQIEKIAGLVREDAECGVVNKKIILASGEVGNLVCCLLVTGSHGSQTQLVVRDIFEIAERKLDGAEGHLLDVLKDILDSTERYLEGQEVKASLIAVFFYKNVCYVARRGEGVRLVVFGDSKKFEIDFETGSGPVVPGQTYLVATEKFLGLFDEETFAHEEADLSEIIDGLATEISAREDQAEIGAVFIRVKEDGGASLETESEGVGKDGGEIVEAGDFAQEELVGSDYTKPEEETINHKDRQWRSDFVWGFAAVVTRSLRRIFKEAVRIRRGDGRAIFRLRRNILILVVLIVLVLGGFASLSFWQKKNASEEARFDKYIADAKAKLKEGEGIIELNKARARQILVEAQNAAKKAEEIKGGDEASRLLAEINARISDTEVSSTVNFSTFAEVDLGVNSLAFNGDKVVGILDNKIVEFNPSGEALLEHLGVDGALDGAVFDNKAFVLTDDEAQVINFSDDKVSKIADSNGAFDIGVFFGNVYLLASGGINKFVPIEGGYAEPKEYLLKKEEFSRDSHMAIDSFVWVSRGGEILKFNRGARENFEIIGLPEGSGDFGIIYTDSNLGNLYVVDSVNSVLLIIGKDGSYKRAISAPELQTAKSMAVNASEDKVFISSDSKILTTSLK